MTPGMTNQQEGNSHQVMTEKKQQKKRNKKQLSIVTCNSGDSCWNGGSSSGDFAHSCDYSPTKSFKRRHGNSASAGDQKCSTGGEEQPHLFMSLFIWNHIFSYLTHRTLYKSCLTVNQPFFALVIIHCGSHNFHETIYRSYFAQKSVGITPTIVTFAAKVSSPAFSCCSPASSPMKFLLQSPNKGDSTDRNDDDDDRSIVTSPSRGLMGSPLLLLKKNKTFLTSAETTHDRLSRFQKGLEWACYNGYLDTVRLMLRFLVMFDQCLQHELKLLMQQTTTTTTRRGNQMMKTQVSHASDAGDQDEYDQHDQHIQHLSSMGISTGIVKENEFFCCFYWNWIQQYCAHTMRSVIQYNIQDQCTIVDENGIDSENEDEHGGQQDASTMMDQFREARFSSMSSPSTAYSLVLPDKDTCCFGSKSNNNKNNGSVGCNTESSENASHAYSDTFSSDDDNEVVTDDDGDCYANCDIIKDCANCMPIIVPTPTNMMTTTTTAPGTIMAMTTATDTKMPTDMKTTGMTSAMTTPPPAATRTKTPKTKSAPLPTQLLPPSPPPVKSDVHLHLEHCLRIAFDRGHCDIVSFMVQHCFVDPSFDNQFLFRHACQNGYSNLVRVLLQDSRVDPSSDNYYGFRMACLYGYANIVHMLLDDGRVNVQVQDNFAIRMSCRYGHLNVFLLLLEEKVDVTDRNHECIQSAAEYGHTEIVKLLLQRTNVDPSADDDYALRMACAYGHDDVVQLLLRCDTVNPMSRSNAPLKMAITNGHSKVVERLVMDHRMRIDYMDSSESYVTYWLRTTTMQHLPTIVRHLSGN